MRRRRRKLAAATSTVLLVAAAVAGEPISLASGATQVAGGVGDGLNGMTDPGSVSASGRMAEDDEIGADLLDGVDDVDKLLELGQEAPNGRLGINGTMLAAYMQAAEALADTQPNCRLHWSLLASIGRIESNHARGGKLDAQGNTSPKILGPVLNGGGFAAIADTDGGRWDGNSRWDRAVGAMQFIPSTWEGYAADGNGDGVRSPHNVYDATVAAGKYLCSGGMDLTKPRDRATAVFRYNHSNSYVATVLTWADAYARGVDPMPSDPVLPDTDAWASGPPSLGHQPPKTTPPTNPPKPPPNTTPPSTPPPTDPTTPPTRTGKPQPPLTSLTELPLPSTTTPTPTCPPSGEELPPAGDEEVPPPSSEVPPPSGEEPPAQCEPTSETPPEADESSAESSETLSEAGTSVLAEPTS